MDVAGMGLGRAEQSPGGTSFLYGQIYPNANRAITILVPRVIATKEE
jgi:hypothetical protein